jgi:hypothetical protein
MTVSKNKQIERTTRAMKKYVAVNFTFDERTNKVECVANKDMTITGENGAIVTLKKGEKFTAVRAASLGENMWYIVRQVSGEKKCSCPATKPCRHEKLVAAVNVARKQFTDWQDWQDELGRDVRKADESTTIQPIRTPKPDMMSAALTTNRGFSLLR